MFLLHTLFYVDVLLYNRSVEGVVSYTAPRGDARSPEAGLEDLSYDGVVDSSIMKGGLGQLTDGLFGADQFTPDLKGQGDQGNRWVGWLNESRPGQPLEITFEFDVTREFSALHLHANNMFTRGVQISGSTGFATLKNRPVPSVFAARKGRLGKGLLGETHIPSLSHFIPEHSSSKSRFLLPFFAYFFAVVGVTNSEKPQGKQESLFSAAHPRHPLKKIAAKEKREGGRREKKDIAENLVV
ncbi:hypothetical protein J437_LFUL000881 [Ladona fulva]|uniref:Discoidin domain-containing protein n=1 Tax=Ladona fulva TaxID=123851 RepID=A0A8K0NZD8_LADFU|nr:hypothetical protein J437_LFUL000881 [Ladona fulva]